MSIKKHPDYEQEVERLEYTKEYIEKTLDATEEYRRLYKENIKDAMVELDYLDSSQSYISIIINSKFIEIADRNFDSLSKSRNKPYFARMDFKQQGSEKIEEFYIGKTTLFKAENSFPLIIDWRSPIANLYYEGRLGKTSYEAEAVIHHGELFLKRQYAIEHGELKDITDVDITTNDAFLQASLEANAEERLKDIASTIQAEQNRVIRADMGKPLIVQGVAGSGKTTIALHRIAYFIYTFEKTFNPEDLMIIAPNKLFINYISTVLPELGVEKVKQTTFIDFMIELLGNKYKLVDPNAKLIYFINHDKNNLMDKEMELKRWSTNFKGSIKFKEVIDAYIEDLEINFVPDIDFSLDGHIIVSKNDIKKIFIDSFYYLPIYKRVSKLKKNLSNNLKLSKQKIIKNIEKEYNEQIERLRYNEEQSENRRIKIVTLIERRDEKLKKINKEAKTLVKKYLDKFPKVDLFDYYKELMSNTELIHKYSKDELPTEKVYYICNITQNLLEDKKIELEDYAPLVYLKHKVFGFSKEIDINSVVIDEAQDFNVFEFYTLKAILNTNMFTLLGDISQGIHSYRGIKNWEEVLEQVFDTENSNYMKLVQSYRTTIEIMELANEIIKKLNDPQIVLAKPVIRHGKKPEIIKYDKDQLLLVDLEKNIQNMQKENFKSIAIICKTKDECIRVKKHLDKTKKNNIKLLDEKQDTYEGGVMLVPSYLAKGLEFDVVIIVNILEKYKEEELDIKLLYVAMTRALHRMYIYHIEGKMPLLEKL